MTSYDVPFNFVKPVGNELAYIAEAFTEGHVSGAGRFSGECHRFLERTLGIPKALLTTSCTHALEMAALLLDVEPGDEVVVPAFTFVSTINAFVLRGAVPVFADIRPDTLNLDEARLEEKLTSRTKAIVVVHYAGVGCEMSEIGAIAARHRIPIVEDNAHGLFGRYRGKYLGTFGALATQSFHETKNFTCGEGGALLINDAELIERAEVVREKGTNRSRFFRGQVDKYTWVDVGSSYLPSDVLAGFLWGQLEAREYIQAARRRIWEAYERGLADWCLAEGVAVPAVPSHCEQAYHMFYLLMHSADERQEFIAHLARSGVLAVFHYVPLHLSPMGIGFGGRPGDCPVTEDVSERLVRLPFYTSLSDDQQERVISAVRTFRCGVA